MKRDVMRENKNLFRKILFVYILFIFFVVVMKFYGDVSAVMDRQALIMADKRDGLDNINLVPFATIRPYLRLFRRSFAYTNILGNLILFIPFGYLIPKAFRRCRTLIRTLALCLVGIVMIELFQYVTCLGFCDIDDVILNSIGSCLGYLIHLILSNRNKSQRPQT